MSVSDICFQFYLELTLSLSSCSEALKAVSWSAIRSRLNCKKSRGNDVTKDPYISYGLNSMQDNDKCVDPNQTVETTLLVL